LWEGPGWRGDRGKGVYRGGYRKREEKPKLKKKSSSETVSRERNQATPFGGTMGVCLAGKRERKRYSKVKKNLKTADSEKRGSGKRCVGWKEKGSQKKHYLARVSGHTKTRSQRSGWGKSRRERGDRLNSWADSDRTQKET